MATSRTILNEDWEDYDNKKIRDQRDRKFFSCEEAWEVDYLVDKIRKHFPTISAADIKAAITSCCATIRAPRPRTDFVECVCKRLGISLI